MSFHDLGPVLPVVRGAPRSDEDLARWIEERYGVEVVETTLERIHDADRLTVWVRAEEHVEPFRDGAYNWDRARNAAIGERLGHSGLFVIAQAVTPLLEERAVEGVNDGGLEAARAVVADPSVIERVFAFSGRGFVFLDTVAQADAFRGSPEHARVADALFALARRHDEFDVLRREAFEPVIDSKQNLDENFEGSTYYYLL